MADSVYKVVELVGTSTESWEKAARTAVERAAKSLRDLRVAEVLEQDLVIEKGKVTSYRTKVKLSFKYEGGGRPLAMSTSSAPTGRWQTLLCAPASIRRGCRPAARTMEQRRRWILAAWPTRIRPSSTSWMARAIASTTSSSIPPITR
jgi:flavin-binding protein dodecin